MKLYLLKDYRFELPATGAAAASTIRSINFTSSLFPPEDTFEYNKSLCEIIRSQTSINWDLTLDIEGFSNDQNASGRPRNPQGNLEGNISYKLKPTSVAGNVAQISILKKLSTDFPGAKLKICVKDFYSSVSQYNSTSRKFETISPESSPIENGEWRASARVSFYPMSVRNPNNGQTIDTDSLYGGYKFTGSVSLSIKLPCHPFNTTLSQYSSEKLHIYKKILEEHVGSDVVILAGNGAKIKAHRSFLSVQSPVFQKMFGSGMKESKSGEVDMTHMSEDAVNAFLAYLYYWDISGPMQNCGIAFELLCAADKYNVPKLEEVMTNVLIWICDEKYCVDVAVQLFRFTRSVTAVAKQNLKIKAVKVLKSKKDELMASPELQVLFKEDSEAAMELLKCFAEVV